MNASSRVLPVVVFLLTVCLSGCVWTGGSGERYSPTKCPPGQAKIVLYRNGSVVGCQCYELVRVTAGEGVTTRGDEEEAVTTVTNGGWFDLDVGPGPVVIETKPRVQHVGLLSLMFKDLYSFSPAITISAEPDQIYYVRFHRSGLSTEQSFDATLMNETEAQEGLKGLKRFGKGSRFYY